MHTLFILRQRNCYPLPFLGFVVVTNVAEPAPVGNALPPSIPLSKQHNINAKLEMPEYSLIAAMHITSADRGYSICPIQKSGYCVA